MKSALLLFCLLGAVQYSMSAQTESPADICGRLQGLLSADHFEVATNANQAIALLRQINLISVVNDATAMAGCWPTVLQATFVPPAAQDANITLSQMGSAEPALKALVDTASTTTNVQLRDAALKLIYSNTSSDRQALRSIGVDKLAALFVAEAEALPLPPAPYPRNFSAIFQLMTVPAISDLTAEARLAVCLSTSNINLLRQLVVTTVIAGVPAKTRVMATLREALTSMETSGDGTQIQRVEDLTALVTRSGPLPLAHPAGRA